MINVALRLSAVACVAAAAAGRSTDRHPGTPPSTSVAVSTQPAAPQAPAPAAPSDEDQISQVLKTYQDAYNTNNWDAYLEVMCPSMRAKFTGAILDSVKSTRATAGITTAEVLSVEISGDNAKLHGVSESGGSATGSQPAAAVPGLPASACTAVPQAGGLLTRYRCFASRDNYTFTSNSRDLTTAHNQIAAQYLMLDKP